MVTSEHIYVSMNEVVQQIWRRLPRADHTEYRAWGQLSPGRLMIDCRWVYPKSEAQAHNVCSFSMWRKDRNIEFFVLFTIQSDSARALEASRRLAKRISASNSGRWFLLTRKPSHKDDNQQEDFPWEPDTKERPSIKTFSAGRIVLDPFALVMGGFNFPTFQSLKYTILPVALK